MTALTGTLDYFALPDVFRLLAQNKVTGGLKVARASGDGTIFLRDGEVYFAFSSLTREFLGQRLVNAKLITQGQLLRILDEQKKGGEKRIGDLLIEKGFISKDMLDTFLREQMQDAIFSMLQWDVGSFEFVPGDTAPQEVGLSVSVENLIMESSRRIQEWEVITRKIPNLDVVVRMAPTPPENAVEINIRPEEWTLLVLADGSRTVREIASASERSEFDACKIIYGLVSAGLLDVASGATAVGREDLPSTSSPFPRHEQAPEDREGAVGAPVGVWEPEEPEVSVVMAVEEAEPVRLEARESPPLPVEETEAGMLEARESPSWVVEETRADETIEPVGDERAGLEVPSKRQRVTKATAWVGARIGDGETEAKAKLGKAASAKRKPGDPTVSKELLLRLIAGVRNL